MDHQGVAQALGCQGRADLQVVNRPHGPCMAQVISLKRRPEAPQRNTQLCSHRAVVPIVIDIGKAFALKRPSLDPNLWQWKTLAGPGFAASDWHQPVDLSLSFHHRSPAPTAAAHLLALDQRRQDLEINLLDGQKRLEGRGVVGRPGDRRTHTSPALLAPPMLGAADGLQTSDRDTGLVPSLLNINKPPLLGAWIKPHAV